MFGWAGKILDVDLSKGKVRSYPLNKDLRSRFLGGRGINAKLLWDLIRKPGIDAFSPENVLIFGTGVLTGTSAPSSGRTTVTCKGAETNLYLKTNMGGHWGAELKFAGYDHVIVRGASKAPVYIWINDDEVAIKDAEHLWGKDVRETDETIKRDSADREIKVCCIGPAGENLVRFASVMNSVYHAAGRGGAGAVMGSKKLKAIVVRGTKTLHVKDPETFRKIALEILSAWTAGSRFLYLYGTSGDPSGLNALGAYPSYNFKTGYVDFSIYPLSGKCLVEKGYLKRRVACFSCSTGCHRFATIEEGPYAGTYSGGPEYESFSALGSGTGIFETEPVLKANELCNIMGLDTISTGSVIQWAMESFERGVLTKEDTDGIELTFGNAEALVKLIPMIAKREGKLGSLLAEGVMRAAKKVGKGSLKWAICNSKGLEQSRVETRSAKAYALAFAVNPRGPDHLHTECLAEFGTRPEGIELIKKITGDRKYATPHTTEYRAEIVRWHEDCYAITDSLGFCAFTSTADGYAVNPKNMAAIYTAVTGIEITEEEIMNIGRGIVTLEKCFNVREGADRKLDDLPWRLMHEPAPAGPLKGAMNSLEEMNKMLDRYYTLHGWDLKTSWPYRETLEKLKLKDVADELEAMGKIPMKE